MKRVFLTLAVAATCLTACNNEGYDSACPSANKIAISPSIVRTRVMEGDVFFEKGDKIGLTIIRADGSLHSPNSMLAYDGSIFMGDASWYTDTNEKSHLTAYYPYNEAGSPESFTVPVDQSDIEVFLNTDLLGASQPDVASTGSAVKMVFKHLLAKIQIDVTNETTTEITSVEILGTIPTAKIDLQKVTVGADDAVSPAGITMCGAEWCRAIIVPQKASVTVAVSTDDGKTRTIRFAETTFRSGLVYNMKVTVTPIDIKATLSGEIEEWTDAEDEMTPATDPEGIKDDAATPQVAAEGFFVANEDWYTHDVGSVNYFAAGSYAPSYRVFRAANPGSTLGSVTQFATIWGDKAYFCSKSGSRFVVADAKTMKAQFSEGLSGEGRAFVGIDDKKGYVSHTGGVNTFYIETKTLSTDKIIDFPPSRPGGPSQPKEAIGNMCLSGNYVFVLGEKNLRVIDTQTDKVVKTVPGTYQSAMARSKDGGVWVAARADKFIRYNPETLESEDVPRPSEYKIAEKWGAWDDGDLCASTQTNTLYWKSGSRIAKYDIDTHTTTLLYTLGTSDYGEPLRFYGTGLRVNPLTDEIVVTVHHGTGTRASYNWIYILNPDGSEKTHFEYFGGTKESSEFKDTNPKGGYYWFPAMPFFEDANKPQILLSRISVAAGKSITVDLSEKIVDYDNSMASIRKSVSVENGNMATATISGNTLKITAGEKAGNTTCTLTAISNGVRVTKPVRIDIY